MGRIALAGCLLVVYLMVGVGDAHSDDPTVLDVGDTIILSRSFIDCTVERHPRTQRKLVICFRLPTKNYEPYAGGMDETGATMVERFDARNRMSPIFFRGSGGAGFIQTPQSFHVKASIVIKSTFVVAGTNITCLYHIDGEKRFVACADKVNSEIVPQAGAHGVYMDETDVVKAVRFDEKAKRVELVHRRQDRALAAAHPLAPRRRLAGALWLERPLRPERGHRLVRRFGRRRCAGRRELPPLARPGRGDGRADRGGRPRRRRAWPHARPGATPPARRSRSTPPASRSA